MSAFKKHIRKSLADPDLQIALDGNATRRMNGRNAAFATLSNSDELRKKARSIREDVIANLDEYVQRLITNAQGNGIIVHRAADAEQARKIVLDICQASATHKTTGSQSSPLLVAKSKSMLSEEIHLNRALEEAGNRVVETDLGEYIIQLRGETPSHLITPAVHLRRQQVGQLFHEKLGVPYTEDIPEMTKTAQRMLREVFLNADVGISGVNFGVADTGTLIILTNEGNGRMVTTLPKVHIALMGMERLVPSLTDLAVMLQLLPRSATGQKLTVYVSMMNGPRHSDDVNGPEQRHLVILDNGRSSIRQSPLAEALYCIRCGACLNACPVFRELGGHAYVGIHGGVATYPGPIGSILSPALFGEGEFGQLARASSLCGACKENCPVDIDLPKLLLRVRTGMVTQKPTQQAQSSHISTPLKFGLKLFSWAATRPNLYQAAQSLAGFGGRILAPKSGWLHLPAFTGWGLSKDMPHPAHKSFQAMWQDNPATESSTTQADRPTITKTKNHEQVTEETVDLAARFKQELETLGGKVTFCSQVELPEKISSILAELGTKRMQTWGQESLPEGLLAALHSKGIETSQDYAADIPVGLTGAVAGIAETGTLLLVEGKSQPSTASLVPQTHLAILPTSQLMKDLAHAFKLSEVRESSLATLITGPSRTADIEMALTIGVHGPGSIHVFCVEN